MLVGVGLVCRRRFGRRRSRTVVGGVMRWKVECRLESRRVAGSSRLQFNAWFIALIPLEKSSSCTCTLFSLFAQNCSSAQESKSSSSIFHQTRLDAV